MTTLIIGRGFVGTALVQRLTDDGVRTVIATRTDCTPAPGSSTSRLDELLDEADQIVLTAQLASLGVDDIVDRVDGDRWLVFSSAQLATSIDTPEIDRARRLESIALARGATVVRPTMIFGHGRDRNISTLVRTILRSPVVPVVGGAALVAPVHVDDVAEFVVGHKSTFDAGLYGLPGPESLPFSELVQDLAAIAGRRGILAKIPKKLLTHLSAVARVMPFLPLRPDQLLRAMEDRDTTGAPSATSVGWTPRPLAHRLEQAVDEIRFHPHDPTGFRTGVDSGDA